MARFRPRDSVEHAFLASSPTQPHKAACSAGVRQPYSQRKAQGITSTPGAPHALSRCGKRSPSLERLHRSRKRGQEAITKSIHPAVHLTPPSPPVPGEVCPCPCPCPAPAFLAANSSIFFSSPVRFLTRSARVISSCSICCAGVASRRLARSCARVSQYAVGNGGKGEGQGGWGEGEGKGPL